MCVLQEIFAAELKGSYGETNYVNRDNQRGFRTKRLSADEFIAKQIKEESQRNSGEDQNLVFLIY